MKATAIVISQLILLLLMSGQSFIASAANDLPLLNLRGEFQQGALIRGTAPAGSKVSLNGETIPVSDQGDFVFGFGRNHKGAAKLTVVYPDGRKNELQQKVAKRDWPTQRIDGLPQGKVTPDDGSLPRRLAEQKLITAARSQRSNTQGFSQDYQWPAIGIITGVFGSQRILNGTPKRPHSGVDVAGPKGAPLVAPADGVVTLIHDDMYYTGGTIILDHGHGVSSTLVHLSKIAVAQGDVVKQGDFVGEIGATGRATGPHLHWTMHYKKTKIDPQLLVPNMAALLRQKNKQD